MSVPVEGGCATLSIATKGSLSSFIMDYDAKLFPVTDAILFSVFVMNHFTMFILLTPVMFSSIFVICDASLCNSSTDFLFSLYAILNFPPSLMQLSLSYD